MAKNKKKIRRIDIYYPILDDIPIENISIGCIYPYIIWTPKDK
jgi:hypothetical protein